VPASFFWNGGILMHAATVTPSNATPSALQHDFTV
jgi:hypothetical protein